MLAKKRFVCVWSMLAIVLLPGLAFARTPLTDSTDVMIPSTRNEAENSVFVSPLNSKVLLVSNIYVQNENPSQITTWHSQDAGKTWTDGGLLSPSFADPAVVIGRNGGTNGRYFVNYLTELPEPDVDTSYRNTTTDTWSWGRVQTHGEEGGFDKNHLWIDNRPSGTFANYLYCGFSELVGISRVYLKYSDDNGLSWKGASGSPTPIFIDAGNGVNRDFRGINLQTGPSGQVYGAWQSSNAGYPVNIGFRYSTDGGATWNSPTNGQYIESLGGSLLKSYPSMTVDQANGNIYVSYSDGTSTGEKNVYVKKSTDAGLTWGSEVRVNTVTTGDQWLPWMAWDDCTGFLSVVYYDTRGGSTQVNTYMAVSTDGAANWSEFKVSDVTRDEDGFAGHYIGLAAKDGIAFPVWSDDRAPRSDNDFRPFISPVYLWGVNQPSVQHSLTWGPSLELTVQADWTTNLQATGTDYLVITSPHNVVYTATGSGTGYDPNALQHRLTQTCTCERGTWKYVVKSTRPTFTSRGSDQKIFTVPACLE